jgi:hypothetical protein
MTSTHKASEGSRSTPAIAGISGVEIKVTIRGEQELKGIRALELNEDSAEVRVIYFYDTPKLDLFNAGVVLRARLVKGDNDDSTVKIRPVEPGTVPQNWSAMPGFKIESDNTGDRVVCSASFTAVQRRDEIDEVAKGKRPIRKLYSPDQERFLSQFCRRPVAFAALRVLGPIRVLHWKTKHKEFPHELTSEEWRLPDGEDLLEVSIKVEPDEAATARRSFENHLRELGLDPAGAQETKTRVALEHMVRTLKPDG